MNRRGWRSKTAVVVAAVAACAPASAAAGGFSTVGLETPPPERIAAGDGWDTRFTVLAHGRTPLAELRPVVRIERLDGDGSRAFRAVPAAADGTYRARVVFPAEGRWRVEIAEHRLAGLSGHRFGEVVVEDEAAAVWSPASVAGNAALALALGLIAGGATWLARRRFVRRPAARHGEAPGSVGTAPPVR